MKKDQLHENKGLVLLADAIYVLLYIPFSLIALLNYLMQPLAPPASFSDLASE